MSLAAATPATAAAVAAREPLGWLRAGWAHALMLLAFAATAMAWLALARDQLAASLAWHVAAVGLTGESLQVRQARAATGGALASAWFWVLFPGFGALAAAMLLLESGRSARRRHEESWELRRLRAAAAARAEKQRGQDLDGDVVPIVEALRSDDPNLQVSAIEALRDGAPKRAVQRLAHARDHQSYEVRFAAADSLNRLATRSLDAIGQAERALAERPGAIECHRELARRCFEHGDLGFDGAPADRACFRRAIEHGAAVLRAQPEAGMSVLVARAQARLDEHGAAEATLRGALERAPGDIDLLLALAELQYERKDFVALRATCAALYHGGRLTDPETLAFAAFWSAEHTIQGIA